LGRAFLSVTGNFAAEKRISIRRAPLQLPLTSSRVKGVPMQLTITAASIQPIVALIAGIVILIFPRILNYVIAIYLIIFGLLGLFPNLLS
jgi:hypothetical protein